jgi:hypothetical protein
MFIEKVQHPLSEAELRNLQELQENEVNLDDNGRLLLNSLSARA